MKNLFIYLLLFFPMMSFSQDFTKKELNDIKAVLKRSNTVVKKFNSESMISIERDGNNEIEGAIEEALFKAGFNVVSNKTAIASLNITNPLNSTSENIEITNTQEYKSVYVVTVSGRFYNGPLIGKCQKALISFSARIVDLLDEGKLVGTFTFNGNSVTYVACESDLANAFAYSLQNPKN